MPEIIIHSGFLLPPFAGGIILGLLFFGTLWLSIKSRMNAGAGLGWFLRNLFIRVSIAVGVMIWMCGDSPGSWGACLLGFIGTRSFLIWSLSFEGFGGEGP